MKAETRKPPFKGTVRISIPAKVAYDLGAFQKSIANLVEELGCKPCFSGADCLFRNEMNFLVAQDLKVSPVIQRLGSLGIDPFVISGADPHPQPGLPAFAGADPQPEPSLVSVSLPVKVGFDIAKISKVVAQIADNLGHAQCVSGFDIFFRNQLELIVNEKAELVR